MVEPQQIFLKQFRHLGLDSPKGARKKDTSQTDIFLTDDESLSLSVCKAAQCDLSAEDDVLGDVKTVSPIHSNETVYEDCREEMEVTEDSREIENSKEMEDSRESEVPSNNNSRLIDAGRKKEESIPVESEQIGCAPANDEGNVERDEFSENFEESNIEVAEEEEFEDGSSEESEESDSSGDPSWIEEPCETSEEEEEEEEEEKMISGVKLPADLREVDSLSLSVCLSETGPVSLASHCGCKGRGSKKIQKIV